jgi:drug/metabolite transporter (DMT)-like permease
LHATWNILAKSSSEKGDVVFGIAIATATICAVAFPFVGPPAMESWPWIVASALCNVLYLHAIARAYARSSFCMAYGIVRALIPPLLFILSYLFLGETARPAALTGLVLVAVSLFLFAATNPSVRDVEGHGLAASLFASLFLAAAVLLDIRGIRAGGADVANLLRYSIASSLVTATLLAIVFCINGVSPLAVFRASSRECYAGAVLLLCSYLCGMWAYAQGPVGLVAPLRESSILLGGALSVLVLRERVTELQWIALVLASVGVLLVQIA